MDPPHFFHADIQPGENRLTPAEARHARQSLRLQPGAAVVLFDGRGRRAAGTIVGLPSVVTDTGDRESRKRPADVTVAVEVITAEPAPSPTLTLIVAACKGSRLDWMIEKCTELGVDHITLARFERSVVQPGPQHIERMERTALEACKQCGRLWLPTFAVDDALSAANDATGGARLLIAHLSQRAEPFATALSDDHSSDVVAIVGPEGGLADAELHALVEAGGETVRLGDYMLRVETAAVAAAATWAGLRRNMAR